MLNKQSEYVDFDIHIKPACDHVLPRGGWIQEIEDR